MPTAEELLADMTGTTIETCIRIMSRWNRDGVVQNDKDGFVLLDKAELGRLASG